MPLACTQIHEAAHAAYAGSQLSKNLWNLFRLALNLHDKNACATKRFAVPCAAISPCQDVQLRGSPGEEGQPMNRYTWLTLVIRSGGHF